MPETADSSTPRKTPLHEEAPPAGAAPTAPPSAPATPAATPAAQSTPPPLSPPPPPSASAPSPPPASPPASTPAPAALPPAAPAPKPAKAPAPAAPPASATPPPGVPPVTGRGARMRRQWDRILDSMKRVWRREEGTSPEGLRPVGGVRREKHKEPRVLFVCPGNTARSQMAEAFARIYGLYAESAGTFPALQVQPEAMTVMREIGVDLSGFHPKPLDYSRLESFDRIVVFGDPLPPPYKRLPTVQEWPLLDPTGFPLDGYRRVRDLTEKRVQRLAKEFGLKPREALAPAQTAA